MAALVERPFSELCPLAEILSGDLGFFPLCAGDSKKRRLPLPEAARRLSALLPPREPKPRRKLSKCWIIATDGG